MRTREGEREREEERERERERDTSATGYGSTFYDGMFGAVDTARFYGADEITE